MLRRPGRPMIPYAKAMSRSHVWSAPKPGRPEAVPAVALPDLQRGGGSEELLRALRPFVSESRRKKIDSMIGVMSAAKLLGSVRGR